MTLCWVCSSSAVLTVPEKTAEELPLSSNFRFLRQSHLSAVCGPGREARALQRLLTLWLPPAEEKVREGLSLAHLQ